MGGVGVFQGRGGWVLLCRMGKEEGGGEHPFSVCALWNFPCSHQLGGWQECP